MLKRFKRIGLALGLAALLLGFVGVGAAQATPHNEFNFSYVYATAEMEFVGGQYYFHGGLRAKIPGQCYQMQVRYTDGAWHTSGFDGANDNINYDPFTSCANSNPNGRLWEFDNGNAVRGLRLTNGVNTATFCSSATECRDPAMGNPV